MLYAQGKQYLFSPYYTAEIPLHNIVLIRLRKHVFIRTRFCTIRINAVRSTRIKAAWLSKVVQFHIHVLLTKHVFKELQTCEYGVFFLKPIIRQNLQLSDITTWLSSRRSVYAPSIYISKGSMPLRCNIYFPKILAIESIRTHIKFNLLPVIRVLTDFLFINEISSAFYFSIFCLQARPTMMD